MPLGMQDSTILVNGARANNGYTVYANCPAQIVRMRILNASGERAFNFGFTANKPFKIITSDGGLLNTPVTVGVPLIDRLLEAHVAVTPAGRPTAEPMLVTPLVL